MSRPDHSFLCLWLWNTAVFRNQQAVLVGGEARDHRFCSVGKRSMMQQPRATTLGGWQGCAGDERVHRRDVQMGRAL